MNNMDNIYRQEVIDIINSYADENNTPPKTRAAFIKVCNEYMDTLNVNDASLREKVANYMRTQEFKDAVNKELGITTQTGASFGDTAEDEGKSTVVELILCLLLGWLGAHRFYRGKYISALIYMFSAGIYGIGILVDAIILVVRLINNR